MARALVSRGKTSLTVRQAELAAQDAVKKMTVHAMDWVRAVSMPCAKRKPVTARRMPETAYVVMIMGLRPMESKSGDL
jgi:hypothetical protein